MKLPRIIIAAVLLTLGLFHGGCASPNIEAASSRLKITDDQGKSVEVLLPKNLDATNLVIVINPKTGDYKLTADKFRADATGVIESGSAKQADAISKLVDFATKAVPLTKAETD